MAKCHNKSEKLDLILWLSLILIVPLYLCGMFLLSQLSELTYIYVLSESVVELLNKMWLGLALGIIFVGIIDKIPRDIVISVLGRKRGFFSILRATFAGVLLDLCSHGILMVGMKLYERGASIGQVMAFLIASPWNSFSLTVILFMLIGLKWTLLFLALSLVISIITGLIFNKLEDKGVVPPNPNKVNFPDDFNFRNEVKKHFVFSKFSGKLMVNIFVTGFKSSKIIIKWLLFGVLIASLIRTFVPVDVYGALFGPTLLGLGLTIVAASVIEVCSEGSAPIASDIMNRANSPGNTFAFLMTSVSTDYTEVMAIKETTKSWKISLFLPLVTLPQIIILGWLLNLV